MQDTGPNSETNHNQSYYLNSDVLTKLCKVTMVVTIVCKKLRLRMEARKKILP